MKISCIAKLSGGRAFALAACSCVCAASLARGGVIPDGLPVNRYAALWQHSPFTIASVEQVVVQAGFASKLALVGIARIGSEDIVTLLNKESQERFTVGAKPNDQDLKLVSVEPNADPLKAAATIQKGGEVAKVRFDQSLLAAQAPQNAAPNGGQQPGPGNGQPPGIQPPGINPGINTVRVRRTLPIPQPNPGTIRPPGN
jgi:hypothetical protein